VKQRVQPLLAMVQGGEFATEKGVSYLEAKHLLLLSYCMHIVFYLMLKAEGLPVKDHPVVLRLVELRLYLEKIRPIDKKMAYQIDKLLLAATKAQTDPQVGRHSAHGWAP
jgi:U3 small nucleolar RNA-associated protein 3